MAKQKKVGIDQIHKQNAAKTLAANIRFASVDDPVRTVVVTSSVPSEGKTTVAIALAEALADSSNRVLLVECDMRRRSVANSLGIHPRSGMYAVLSGQVALSDAVVGTDTRGVYLLDCEPRIPNPDALLSSKRFRNFAEAARSSFDYVIFDTPPLPAFVDAAILSGVADGTLLVVGQNIVRRDELTAAYKQLQKAGANVIGAVMNQCESEKSEYYAEYYSRGGDDSSAPSVPAAAPLAARASSKPDPQPARRSTGHEVASSIPAGAAPGFRPLPNARSSSAGEIAPDSTAQFIASAGTGSKKR